MEFDVESEKRSLQLDSITNLVLIGSDPLPVISGLNLDRVDLIFQVYISLVKEVPYRNDGTSTITPKTLILSDPDSDTLMSLLSRIR